MIVPKLDFNLEALLPEIIITALAILLLLLDLFMPRRSGLELNSFIERMLQLARDGQEIHLTPIEYKLLTTLIRYAGKVLTHRQLLKEVWGPLHLDEGHYLRVYMRQLRNKLERNPAHPRYLMTELGVGYRLRTE